MTRRLFAGISILGLLTWGFLSGPSYATVDVVSFDDPEKAALYQDMIRELRCLVCQNQNLADSNAELAQDLRRKTKALIDAGKDRSDIVQFMVSRYGDFVLYRPRFTAKTAFLWASPAILFLFLLWWVLRWRRRLTALPSGYSESELQHARSLLRDSHHQRGSRSSDST